jgi:hypothetical protein
MDLLTTAELEEHEMIIGDVPFSLEGVKKVEARWAAYLAHTYAPNFSEAFQAKLYNLAYFDNSIDDNEGESIYVIVENKYSKYAEIANEAIKDTEKTS